MLTWMLEFGARESVFCALFLLLYLIYLARTRRLASYFQASGRQTGWKLLLRVAAFGLLVVALLGPVLGKDRQFAAAAGKDLMLVADLSRSMNAADLPPSRLGRMKYELLQIIRNLGADRAGLIVFSDEAYVQCPLTSDQEALALFVHTLSTGLLPTGGTNAGAALRLAAEKLREEKISLPAAPAQAIVLFTDGEETGSATETAARELEQQRIQLLVVGLGSEKGGFIPETGGFLKNEDGARVVSRLDRDRLRQMARAARGSFFELSPALDQTPALQQKLLGLKSAARSGETIDIAADKYLYPLLLALLLLVIDALVPVTVIKV